CPRGRPGWEAGRAVRAAGSSTTVRAPSAWRARSSTLRAYPTTWSTLGGRQPPTPGRSECSHAHRADMQARSSVAHARRPADVPVRCGVSLLAFRSGVRVSRCPDPCLFGGPSRPSPVGALRPRTAGAVEHRGVGTWHGSWTRHSPNPTRRASGELRKSDRRAIVASKLSKRWSGVAPTGILAVVSLAPVAQPALGDVL